VLTFPRELYLRTDEQGTRRLASRPAPELTGLRGAVLPAGPGTLLAEHAFEVLATGPLRLSLQTGPEVAVIVATSGSTAEPARVFVDGSLVEVFAGGHSWTSRAYPTADSRWRVDGSADALVVHRLSVGGGGN
jgi:hypothetical protein